MRSFFADTLALIAFFTVTGVLNEHFVAGMDWDEVGRARLFGAALMVPTARPYGVWRDWLLRRFAGPRATSQLTWDSVTLLVFQVPLYALVLRSGGADMGEILRGCLGVSVIMLVYGRPYGLWLDLVRRWFGLEAGGTRPMSLRRCGL